MKPHPLDTFSLLTGALLTLLGVGFLLDALDVLNPDQPWISAVVLIALGTLGVATGVRRSRTT